MIPGEATFLRLYTNSNEQWHGIPLYRAIVEEARNDHLGGLSVFPVELGYGARRRIHDRASEYSSFEIPVSIEIVDSAERLVPFVAKLETMVSEGLVVMSLADVIRYVHAAEVSDDLAVRPETSMGDPSRREQASNEDAPHMKIEGDAKRVTVYIGSADRCGGRNLAVAIVEKCREMGLAGATVSRGIMGFGKQSVIHKAHFLGLSDDLPEKIEVIDRPEEIERLLPVLDKMIGGGLIIVEDVRVLRYLHDPKSVKTTKA
jgi:PII-like signaling protein